MNPFFQQGFWHFLQAPSHIIVLFGMGLLLGQQGMPRVRVGLICFVISIISALLLVQLVVIGWKHDVVLLGLAMVVGGLLAIRLDLPVLLIAIAAALSGFLIGIDSAPALIPGMKKSMLYAGLTGTALSTSLAVSSVALVSYLVRTTLNGMILRVLGSWVTASSLMVLALMFAPS
ncbi:MAG: hypothetical protein AAF434_13480 [Pseudomonadota bacterium]